MSDTHVWQPTSPVGMTVMIKSQSYRLITQNNWSDVCENNWKSAYVTIRRQNGATAISNTISLYLITSEESTNILLYNLRIFQIHGSAGKHNAFSTVWTISAFLISDVSGRPLLCYGKYLIHKFFTGVTAYKLTYCRINLKNWIFIVNVRDEYSLVLI